MGGGTNPNNALLQIKLLSASLVGNKTILICTDGDVNCKDTVNYFIAVNILPLQNILTSTSRMDTMWFAF